MKLISLRELCESNLHIEGIRALNQRWENRTYSFLKTPRPDQGLCLILKGRAIYRIKSEGREDEYLEALPGDLLYLPLKSRYSVRFYSDGEAEENYLLNFMAYDSSLCEVALSDRVTLLAREASPRLSSVFAEAVEACSVGTNQSTCRRKAAAYTLLSRLDGLAAFAETKPRDCLLISPGIEYLEANFTKKLCVCDLAAKCHISETYFRRLFKAYTGMSPLEYKSRLVTDAACRLLSSKELTLWEIASRLGYCDTAHFCRSFKKATGKTPGEIRLRPTPLKRGGS